MVAFSNNLALMAMTMIACSICARGAPQNIRMRNQPSLRPNREGFVDTDAYLQEINTHVAKWSKSKLIPRDVRDTKTKTAVGSTDGAAVAPRADGDAHHKERRKNLDGRTNIKLDWQQPEPYYLVGHPYYGKVKFGTQPDDDFYTRFDTTSSDVIVPGAACDDSSGCFGERKYQEKGDFVDDGGRELNFLYGLSVSASQYRDSITIGGIEVYGGNVFSIVRTYGLPIFQSNSIASVGLAFHNVPHASGELSWPQRAFGQGAFTRQEGRVPEFSFFFGRIDSNPDFNTVDESQLTIGGHDEDFYTGDIQRMPLVNRRWWEINVSGATVDVSSLQISVSVADQRTEGTAIIETAASLITIPVDVAERIFRAIPGSFGMYHVLHTVPQPPPDNQNVTEFDDPSVGGMGRVPLPMSMRSYAFPCDLAPEVSLLLGPHDDAFAIDPRDLSYGQISKGDDSWVDVPGSSKLADYYSGMNSQMCLAAIAGQDAVPGAPRYLLGTSFLKSWYTILSLAPPESVGFAKAINENRPPNDSPSQVLQVA